MTVVNDDTEWSLDPIVFKEIHKLNPNITVGLFASRVNNKLTKCVSQRPDPDAFAIDAFSMTWCNDCFFMFPPFSMIPRTLQKVTEDKTTAITPIWPAQSWWPSLLQLICGNYYKLP